MGTLPDAQVQESYQEPGKDCALLAESVPWGRLCGGERSDSPKVHSRRILVALGAPLGVLYVPKFGHHGDLVLWRIPNDLY